MAFQDQMGFCEKSKRLYLTCGYKLDSRNWLTVCTPLSPKTTKFHRPFNKLVYGEGTPGEGHCLNQELTTLLFRIVGW